MIYIDTDVLIHAYVVQDEEKNRQANEVLGENLPANAKRVLKKGDVIISKVRTYSGAITIVEENGYVGSGAFCVMEENGQINKETLLAFLHCKPLLGR